MKKRMMMATVAIAALMVMVTVSIWDGESSDAADEGLYINGSLVTDATYIINGSASIYGTIGQDQTISVNNNVGSDILLNLSDDLEVQGKLIIASHKNVTVKGTGQNIDVIVGGTLEVGAGTAVLMDRVSMKCYGTFNGDGIFVTVNDDSNIETDSTSLVSFKVDSPVVSYTANVINVTTYSIKCEGNASLDSFGAMTGNISGTDVGDYAVSAEIKYTKNGSASSTLTEINFYWTIAPGISIVGSGYYADAGVVMDALDSLGRGDIDDVAPNTMYVVYGQGGFSGMQMMGKLFYKNGSDDRLVEVFSEELLDTDGVRCWYFSFADGQQVDDWDLMNGQYIMKIYANGNEVRTGMPIIVNVNGQDPFIKELGSGYYADPADVYAAFGSMGITYVEDVAPNTMYLVYAQNGYTSIDIVAKAFYLNSVGIEEKEIEVFSQSFVSADGIRIWYFSFDDQYGEAKDWTPLNGNYDLYLYEKESMDTLIGPTTVTISNYDEIVEEIGSGYFVDPVDTYDALEALGITYVDDIASETMYLVYAQNGHGSMNIIAKAYYVNMINGIEEEIQINTESFTSVDGVRIWYFSFADGQPGNATDWTPIDGKYKLYLYDENDTENPLMDPAVVTIENEDKIFEEISSGYFADALDAYAAFEALGITYVDDIASETMFFVYRQNGYTDSQMTGRLLYYNGSDVDILVFSEQLLSDNGVRIWYFSFEDGQQVSGWDLVNGDYTFELYADEVFVDSIMLTISDMSPFINIKGSGYNSDVDIVEQEMADLGRGDINDVIGRTMYMVYSQNGYINSHMKGVLKYDNATIFEEDLLDINGIRAWYFSFDDQLNDIPCMNGTYTLEIYADEILIAYSTVTITDGYDWSYIDFNGVDDSTFNDTLIFNDLDQSQMENDTLMKYIEVTGSVYFANYYWFNGYFLEFVISASDISIGSEVSDWSIEVYNEFGYEMDIYVDDNGRIVMYLGSDYSWRTYFNFVVDFDGEGTSYLPVDYNVSLDLEDGTEFVIEFVYKNGEKFSIIREKDAEIQLPSSNDNDGFIGWFNEDDWEYYLVNQFFKVDSDSGRIITFTASYDLYEIWLDGETYFVDAYVGQAITLPWGGVKPNEVFAGWYLNGTKISGQYIVSAADAFDGVIDIFSIYNDMEPEPLFYTVNFEMFGQIFGSCTVKEGDMITLPSAAVEEGYAFAGWYDGEDFVGTWGSVYTPWDDVTLTASFVSLGVNHISYDAEGNGSVLGNTSAFEGDYFFIFVSPEGGFVISDISIFDSDENPVPCYPVLSGSLYMAYMGDKDLYVMATFAQSESKYDVHVSQTSDNSAVVTIYGGSPVPSATVVSITYTYLTDIEIDGDIYWAYVTSSYVTELTSTEMPARVTDFSPPSGTVSMFAEMKYTIGDRNYQISSGTVVWV